MALRRSFAPMQEQHLVDQLGDDGHEPDHDAGEGADDGGEGDQPDLVGAHQGAQEVWRVHHHVAEWAAVAGGCGAGRCAVVSVAGLATGGAPATPTILGSP